MTVQELIEKLQMLPQDLTVQQYTYDDYQDEPVAFYDVEEVKLSDDGKNVQIHY
jgi:hypothetical protein